MMLKEKDILPHHALYEFLKVFICIFLLKFSRKHDQYKAKNVYIFVDAEEIKATHMWFQKP